MDELPTGTVTFLFTDIEGSTRAWQASADAMERALEQHDTLMYTSVERHGGLVFKHTGDGICAAFATACDAAAAAIDAQRELREAAWQPWIPLRVRMALHTGVARPRNGDYVGPTLNHCARVLSLAHPSQILCSQTTADLTRETPPANIVLVDLGQHRLRDLSGTERIYEVRWVGEPDEFPPLREPGLPHVRTNFIGRHDELHMLTELVQHERLITLAGIGGAGKSRLALQTATDLLEGFPGGVFFIELAPVVDPSLVAPVVAQGVGAPAVAGRPAEDQLTAHLANERALVVIDNCEHVGDACAQLIDRLLGDCPAVVVLATSREPLRVVGEHVWPVPPMATERVDDPSQADAVRLFVDRARLAGATIDESMLSTITQICARLDGIPLAIELAAARSRHLAPTEILDRLADRFRLLTGGSAPLERHQTLRATMDWSYGFLKPAEQQLFRRLAVFVGTFTLEAAEGICANDPAEPFDVLEILSGLVDRSLVIRDQNRYRLLETVRQYAAAKLDAHGETHRFCERHCTWYTNDTARRVPLLPFGSLESRAQRELIADLENLRAAIEWSLDHDHGRRAHTLLARASGCWQTIGNWDDLARWLPAAIEGASSAPASERAAVLSAHAMLKTTFGEMAAAFDLGDEILALAKREALDAVVPVVLNLQGISSQASGRADPVILLTRAITVAEQVGDDRARRQALWELGEVLMVQGRLTEADDLLARALPGATPAEQASTHLSRAVVAHIAGDVAVALSEAEQGVALADQSDATTGLFVSNTLGTPLVLVVHGVAFAAAGELGHAGVTVTSALRETIRYRIPLAAADCLVGCAGVALHSGQPERAARLLGAARTEFGHTGSWRSPIGGALYVHYVSRVRAALPPEIAEQARRQGRALTLDEAVTDVLGSCPARK